MTVLKAFESPLRWGKLVACGVGCLVGLTAAAATLEIPAGGVGFSGLIMDAKGAIHFHEPDAKEMEEAKAKALKPVVVAKEEKLCFISLPRLLPIIKELQLREKPVPDELKYLGGLTQIKYVFAYPDERELVIVGPYEPWDTTNPVQAVGKTTGRPIIQLDDLVAAMRTARSMHRGGENGGTFGCSISPAKGVEERVAKVTKEYAQKPRPEKMAALTKAIGPQQVKVFNTNENTRLALVCVAADCKLKRYALGVEAPPVPGIGVAVESSARVPNSHVWFELAYEPLLTSEDGFAFELKGPRLQVKVGEEEFSDKDATHRAVGFAKQMNQKMPQLCASVAAFADLQNMADLAVATTLIKIDKLDDKVKWDSLPVHAVIGWEILTLPPPKTVDTVVAYTNGAIVQGGVALGAEAYLDPDTRKVDKKNTLKPMYDTVQKMLDDVKTPIWATP